MLETRENYAFAEAVDILDREKSSYLLNIYEGPLLRTYLPCFDQLDACPDFQGVFLEGESLVAVFRYRAGTPIDQVFYRGDPPRLAQPAGVRPAALYVYLFGGPAGPGELRGAAVGERAGQ